MMQKRIRSKKEIWSRPKNSRGNNSQGVVLCKKWRFDGKTLIVTAKTVFTNPGSAFFFTLHMLMMREHIMQYLLWCYADGKNAYQKSADNGFYDSRQFQNMLQSCKSTNLLRPSMEIFNGSELLSVF